ncbi:MAG: ABC transporter substrate-binding protein [Candidatus Phytoplasma pyri]
MSFKNYLSKKNNKIMIIINLLFFLILGIIVYFSLTSVSDKDLIIKQKIMIDNFDYQQKDSSLYTKRMHDIVHESLTAYNYDTKKYEPRGLVDSFEEIKDPKDNNIIIGYKFILKSNIKFHNKEILKPSDILYTFQRGLEKNPDNVILGKLDIKRISKDCNDNNNTITIYYKKDFDTSNMFFELSQVYILNKKACEGDNLDGCKIGLGFFYLLEWKTNSADEVILKRFDDFYDKKIRNDFNRIIFQTFEDDRAAIQEVEKDKDNTIYLDVDDSNIVASGELNNKIKQIPIDMYSLRFLMLNCPNTKKHVRKLIAQSLDMEKIFEDFKINDYFLTPNSFIYSSEFLGYDIKNSLRNSNETFEETKKKVEKLPPEKKTITFVQSSSYGGIKKRILDKIVSELERVGFKVKREQGMGFNEMIESCSKPDSKHNIVVLSDSFGNFDISADIKSYFYVSDSKTEGLDKTSFFKNSEFEQLIQNIDKIDKITKEERLKKIGKILSEHMPVYPIFANQPGTVKMLLNKDIKGIKTHFGLINLKNAFI